jgi:hypothetical protein
LHGTNQFWHHAANEIWEIVADKLSATGWSWGYCSAVTRDGWRWIVDAHKGGGCCYIVESDELLGAFVELEATLLRSLRFASTAKKRF